MYDPETGETWDCRDLTLALDKRLLCQSADPGIIHAPLGEPVGWEQVVVDGDTIIVTCGGFRAQDGYTHCSMPFEGERWVKYMFFLVSGSDEPEFKTSGHIKNYPVANDMYYYGTFVENNWYQPEKKECREFRDRSRYAYGLDGWIQPSYHASCKVSEARGTWGVGLHYRKDPIGRDDHLKTEKTIIYAK